jgi:hypothetical protein
MILAMNWTAVVEAGKILSLISSSGPICHFLSRTPWLLHTPHPRDEGRPYSDLSSVPPACRVSTAVGTTQPA